MIPKRRNPYYEREPIQAGSRFLKVTVKQRFVPEGYEHEGNERIVKYVVTAGGGVVNQTKPFGATRNEKPEHEIECTTLEEAEARGDEIEAEYDRRGWREYDMYSTELE